MSYEYVFNENPDLLFVIDRISAIGEDETNNDLASNALVQQTTAFKNGEIIFLTPDIWYLSGEGTKSTQLMIEEIKSAIQ